MREVKRIFEQWINKIHELLIFFQARENDGYIENGGDLEESDIEYDHNNGGAGGKRSSGNRNHSRKGKRSTNRSGASGPDQFRYDILLK